MLIRVKFVLLFLVARGQIVVQPLVTFLDELFKDLLSFLVAGFLVEHARLDNLVVEVFLGGGPREDTLYDHRLGDEPVDSNFRLLADSVGSVFGLLVHLGVEVRVKDDYRIGNLQVETLPTSPGRQDEDAVLRGHIVEHGHVLVAIFLLHRSVELQMLDASVLQETAQDLQELSELTENKDFVTRLDHLRQNPVQKLELAAAHPDSRVVNREGIAVQDQVGVIHSLPESHECVPERLVADFTSLRIGSQSSEVRDSFVDGFLPRGELNFDHHLALGRQFLLNLRFDPPQQEWSENLVKPIDDKQLLFLRKFENLVLFFLLLLVL